MRVVTCIILVTVQRRLGPHGDLVCREGVLRVVCQCLAHATQTRLLRYELVI